MSTIRIRKTIDSETLTLLRAWRDEFARSHAYDVHAMAEALRALDSASDRKVVRGEPRRPVAVRTPNPSLPTGAASPVHGNSKVAETAPAAER
jgi:hypothetical protein